MMRKRRIPFSEYARGVFLEELVLPPFASLLITVPRAPYGDDVLRILRVFLDLLAEPLDVDGQRLDLGIAVAAPDIVEDIFLAQRGVLILDQKLKQRELFLRDHHGLSADSKCMLHGIQAKIPVDDLLYGVFSLKDALDLSQQDIDIIWLLDIVVGAERQALELAVFIALGTGDDDVRIR